jgi:hypothetical protein
MAAEVTDNADTKKTEATSRLLNTLIASNFENQLASERCRHMKARFSALMAFLEVCFDIQETEGDIELTAICDVLYNFALEGYRMQPVDSALEQLAEQLRKRHALNKKG